MSASEEEEDSAITSSGRMCLGLRNRAGSVQRTVIAALLLVVVIYLPVTFVINALLPRAPNDHSMTRKSNVLHAGLAGGDWTWGGNQAAEWDEQMSDGSDNALLKENHQRYQAEVDELKVIARSLRDEIHGMHGQMAARQRGGNSQEETDGSKARQHHKDHHSHLSLRVAGVMAEQEPGERDNEYDMRCPQSVDDIAMLASPVRLTSQPRLPKIMPPPESFVDYAMPKAEVARQCTTSQCMDLARCSVSRPFRVYLYNETISGSKLSAKASSTLHSLLQAVRAGVLRSGYLTADPNEACIFLVAISTNSSVHTSDVSTFLNRLPYWHGDGRNHVIIDLPDGAGPSLGGSQLPYQLDTGNAILASPHSGYGRSGRYKFDFFLSLSASTAAVGENSESAKSTAESGQYTLLPAFRQVLLQFSAFEHTSTGRAGKSEGHLISSKELAELQKSGGSEFSFQLDCSTSDKQRAFQGKEDTAEPGWYWCGGIAPESHRSLTATFTLIIEPLIQSLLQVEQFIASLMQCLQLGSIPVVLRTESYALPFDEVLDWSKAAVLLPAARVSELNYILVNIAEDDILSKKQQGHFLWETYLSTTETVVTTLINVVRRRLGLPANPLQSVSLGTHLQKAAPSSYTPLSSPAFQQNFTYDCSDRWNSPPGGMLLPPLSPFVRHKPSGWEYIRHVGNQRKIHPVIEAGGALWGTNFQNYLSGTRDPERFTVVLLTYQRPLVLYNALQRLAMLPRLDRVIVIWNNEHAPDVDVAWPTLDVPLEVVKVERNSLNNRFLPLDSIQTEAILSLDDDTHLRKEEIDFAFRTWRENRHRLVGFPGRFHSWDSRNGGWSYNANYSCELSMVLTGAAFIHKFYLHMYSHFMDERIRAHVDKVMNCEDIAMNMLVSHYTRQPPIKVTLRWTFRCAGCTDALSDNTEHFQERHQCMNIFAGVYGYMPLIKTQTRVDSVLFKTRLPHDKGKCYTFV